jgi:hypothetical protein
MGGTGTLVADARDAAHPAKASPSSVPLVLSKHRFASLVDPLREDPTFVAKPMFGCVACYVGGRLVVVLADRHEPWQGLLLPTERSVHPALRADFPDLHVHPVLPKWLYLPHGGGFAATAPRIVERIAAGDPRFGVEPDTPRLPRWRFDASGERSLKRRS